MEENFSTTHSTPGSERHSYPLTLVMVLAAAAGAFHVLATVEHFAESVFYGVFFAVAATGQLAWAAWIYRRPHPGPRSLTVGAAGNLAVVAVWIWSRITGVPVGPEAGIAETVGLIDVMATVNELAIVALVVTILQPSGRWAGRLAGLTADQQTRSYFALITATVFALLIGSQQH